MSTERNTARVVEMIERVMNGHDPDALATFTSNPAVIGSARALLAAFPDVRAEIQWIVAEGDMVVAYHSLRGTQRGPWLFIEAPTQRVVETAFLLAFRFDEQGQIIDQWLGSNFIEMLAQLGWGFAPLGRPASAPR